MRRMPTASPATQAGTAEAEIRRNSCRGRPAAHHQRRDPPAEHRQHRKIRRARGGMGARRIELAHAQYYGWALANRDALMPTRAQAIAAVRLLEDLRRRYDGSSSSTPWSPTIMPDFPRLASADGDAGSSTSPLRARFCPATPPRRFPGSFRQRKEKPLAEIWRDSPGLQCLSRNRWMPEPCRSCDRKEIDWGGCRCQAMAITGRAENTDPACSLSAFNGAIRAIAEEASGTAAPHSAIGASADRPRGARGLPRLCLSSELVSATACSVCFPRRSCAEKRAELKATLQ